MIFLRRREGGIGEKQGGGVYYSSDTGFEFNYWGVWERAEKDNLDVFWQAWRKELKNVLCNQNYEN